MHRKRNEYPKLTTPKAPAIWPALNEPDFKFKKDTGEWHARLRIPADELDQWQPIIDAAQEILDEAFEAKKEELTKAKKGALLKDLNKGEVPIKPEVDPETGEETGFYIFRASLTYKVEVKEGPKAGKVFYKRPDIFDARGKQLKNPPKIGGASVLKLSVLPVDYWFPKDKTIGVRFELEGVQVIKLVSGGSNRSAGDYGFGEEEGDEIDDLPEAQCRNDTHDDGEGADGGGNDDF